MKTLMNYLNSVLNYGYETLLYLLFDISSNNVIDYELLDNIKIDGLPNLNSNNETLNNSNKETNDNICCEIV